LYISTKHLTFLGTNTKVKVKVTLRLTVSQSVCLGVEPKYGTFDQRFFFSKFHSCHFWGALSDERSGLSCVSLVFEVYSMYTFMSICVHRWMDRPTHQRGWLGAVSVGSGIFHIPYVLVFVDSVTVTATKMCMYSHVTPTSNALYIFFDQSSWTSLRLAVGTRNRVMLGLLCGLVVRVPSNRSRGPCSISCANRFLRSSGSVTGST
jgi:hypothetical protein